MEDKIVVSESYDYIGIYLTNKCHLNCDYCITAHYGSGFQNECIEYLSPVQWIESLNRLVLPADVPITLQGGEPFLYKGIWEILEGLRHKIDILTALPPFLTREHFLKLKTLQWNKRKAPYPTIRVSYHKGQHDYRELIRRIAGFNDILSIGLYCLEHPSCKEEEIAEVERLGKKFGVEVRRKQFLGCWNGKLYGTFKYPDACTGKRNGLSVKCRNTVVPVAPNGDVYRCHSDMYFRRQSLKIGSILDKGLEIKNKYYNCNNYGTCSECDVKIKTNRYQVYGYTSVDIKSVPTCHCPISWSSQRTCSQGNPVCFVIPAKAGIQKKKI